MFNKAIEKINKEMVQNNGNNYIQVVGSFLLQHLESNPNSAGKILTEGKTIGNSLNEMRNVAEKKKVGNCAVLTDQEGFEVVLNYFGIGGKPIEVGATKIIQEAKPVVKKSFDVSLDELL